MIERKDDEGVDSTGDWLGELAWPELCVLADGAGDFGDFLLGRRAATKIVLKP